uniref:Secreted protein n=1 Tax=Gracilaria robusta TaxID=38400 RepID=O46326_9FLOR|nr:ORF7 [Gracilaria robusta]
MSAMSLRLFILLFILLSMNRHIELNTKKYIINKRMKTKQPTKFNVFKFNLVLNSSLCTIFQSINFIHLTWKLK